MVVLKTYYLRVSVKEVILIEIHGIESGIENNWLQERHIQEIIQLLHPTVTQYIQSEPTKKSSTSGKLPQKPSDILTAQGSLAGDRLAHAPSSTVRFGFSFKTRAGRQTCLFEEDSTTEDCHLSSFYVLKEKIIVYAHPLIPGSPAGMSKLMKVLKRKSVGQGVSISSYFQKVPSQTSSQTRSESQSGSNETQVTQCADSLKSCETQSMDSQTSVDQYEGSVAKALQSPPSEGRRNKIKNILDRGDIGLTRRQKKTKNSGPGKEPDIVIDIDDEVDGIVNVGANDDVPCSNPEMDKIDSAILNSCSITPCDSPLPQSSKSSESFIIGKVKVDRVGNPGLILADKHTTDGGENTVTVFSVEQMNDIKKNLNVDIEHQLTPPPHKRVPCYQSDKSNTGSQSGTSNQNQSIPLDETPFSTPDGTQSSTPNKNQSRTLNENLSSTLKENQSSTPNGNQSSSPEQTPFSTPDGTQSSTLDDTQSSTQNDTQSEVGSDTSGDMSILPSASFCTRTRVRKSGSLNVKEMKKCLKSRSEQESQNSDKNLDTEQKGLETTEKVHTNEENKNKPLFSQSNAVRNTVSLKGRLKRKFPKFSDSDSEENIPGKKQRTKHHMDKKFVNLDSMNTNSKKLNISKSFMVGNSGMAQPTLSYFMTKGSVSSSGQGSQKLQTQSDGSSIQGEVTDTDNTEMVTSDVSENLSEMPKIKNEEDLHIKEEINAITSIAQLNKQQIEYLVRKSETYLRRIFEGKSSCERHCDYKSGGSKKRALNHQFQIGHYTEVQIDAVMEGLMAMFCKRHTKYLDYLMKVLLPEMLLKLHMDIHGTSHAESERMMAPSVDTSMSDTP